MVSPSQQRELWIYLAVSWWIGSLAVWLIAWLSVSSAQPNDSLLTASGLLVFGVSACLRLPVLTVQTPTSTLEDHFVWLLAASANMNWLGILCLQATSLTAAIPVVMIGLALEWWLWNQAGRFNCLAWARTFATRLFDSNGISTSAGQTQSNNLEQYKQLETQLADPPWTKPAEEANSTIDSMETQQPYSGEAAETFPDRNVVQRTVEDGLDPTGRRYMSGEVALEWLPDQRLQTVVIGFVPAFLGDPEVELELNCDECTAQILNCTPAGMRIQLKRTKASAQLTSNLCWYARQADSAERLNLTDRERSLN